MDGDVRYDLSQNAPPPMPLADDDAELPVRIADRYGLGSEHVTVVASPLVAMWGVLQAFVGRGRFVLVPELCPAEISATAMVSGGRVVRYWLEDDVPVLDEALGRVREAVLVLCDPRDPDGRVMDPSLKGSIIRWAGSRDHVVVVDESQSGYLWTGHFASGIEFRLTNLVVVDGAAGGIGWTVSSPEMQQRIALAATPGGVFADVHGLDRDAVKRSRDLGIEVLQRYGISVAPADATPYLWVPIDATGQTAQSFANQLVRLGVRVVPGAAYGPAGEGYVRVTAGPEAESVVHGCELLGQLYCQLALR